MLDPFLAQWKPSTLKPTNDQSILISWRNSERKWQGPYLGYYVADEDKYFTIDSGIPVQVDIWIELPEFP